MDAYDGGKYYTIDVSSIETDKSSTIDVGAKTGRAIMGKTGGVSLFCMPTALAMLALAGTALRRR